jgi:uncharacterized protein
MTSMERNATLDALRGAALFGILVVNVPFFFQPDGTFGTYGLEHFPGWHNRAVEFITSWLFDGKFILIFSFLFGWGLHVQMTRSDTFAAPYFRRLLGLFLIGLAHAVFLFLGDILVTYAMLGLVLYPIRDWTPRRLTIGAAVLWLISTVAHAGLGAAVMQFPTEFGDYSRLVQLHQFGSFWQITSQRIEDVIGLYIITPFLFAPQVLGMFMLGLATAKRFGHAGGSAELLPIARKILRWLWLPALLLNAFYALANNTLIFNAAIALGARGAFVPLLSLVYISAALLIFSQPQYHRYSNVFGGEGKLSLSTYIGESVLMSTLALSYGFGLYGKVSPVQGLLLCIAVYITLMVLGSLWSRFFRIGPCEWILRSITQGKSAALTHPAES